MTTMSEQERSERFEAQRQRIREQYLRPADERSASSARGLHHTALVSSDVEQTVRFYQDLLEFPLTELIENRDYPGSSHFFFDIGNDNLLAFFDFPGLDQGPYQEVSAGCTTSRSAWSRRAGSGCGTSSPRPAWSSPSTAASRYIFGTRTGPASN